MAMTKDELFFGQKVIDRVESLLIRNNWIWHNFYFRINKQSIGERKDRKGASGVFLEIATAQSKDTPKEEWRISTLWYPLEDFRDLFYRRTIEKDILQIINAHFNE